MNILIADKVPSWLTERLAAAGCEVMLDPALEADALTEAIRRHQPQVLLVRSTKVQAPQIEATDTLRLIIRAGAGVNTIDVALATTRDVRVANCPGKNASAVAELAIGLLLSLDRRIPDNVADLRAGRWAKKEYAKAQGLRGRTLGLLGLGNIGREVAAIARAMGMKVLAWDPFVSADACQAIDVTKVETAEELAAASDALSVHLALVPATRGLVGRELLGAMKPGAFLINTSRADIVDKGALVEAIREKGLRAGLDVFWDEPAANDKVFADDVVGLPGVFGTHHIGASTQQAQDAVAEETLRILETYIADGAVLNCVNAP